MEPLDICIDVSHYQGAIDWKEARGGGIRIAMIKATQGVKFIDPMFEAHKAGAESVDIAVIPYHFVEQGMSDLQAEFFIKTAQVRDGMAVALDWEFYQNKMGSRIGALSQDVEEIGIALTKQTGRLPLGYWGIAGSIPTFPSNAMMLWPRWIARYPRASVKKWSDLPESIRNAPDKWWLKDGLNCWRVFAQYTRWGEVRGVTGEVDRSVAFFDDADAAVAWVKDGRVGIVEGPDYKFRSASASQLQQRLADLGYSIRIDGVAGALTCGAALEALKGVES